MFSYIIVTELHPGVGYVRSHMRLLLLLAVLVSGSLAASCSQDKGVVYGTGSIKTIQGIKSADDCCVECFNFGYTCAAFTLDTSNQICYLKDNTNGRKTMPDRISLGKLGPVRALDQHLGTGQ